MSTIEPPELPSEFLVIGHRGARGHAPENTLLSIDSAIQQGADMVEVDLHLVGDTFVLIHDPRLERTTNGRGHLRHFSLEQLRTLDAGQGQQIPTLDEALELIEQRVPVNLELKSFDGAGRTLAAQLKEWIADGWPPSRLLVSSFHHPELYEFHQLLPEAPIAPLICGVPLDWGACATELQAQSLNISSEFVDARLITDVHEHGIKLMVYTVNDPEEALELLRMGVDGVFSDYPDRILAILRHEGLRT